MPEPVLPDLLQPGLRLVFCGTAAGTMSAAKGQYYAHPQNKFWRTLHRVGLTPRLFAPGEFALLPALGIGLTDIAKHVSGMDSELPPQSLGRDAVEALRARIAANAPCILAFTSQTGGKRVCGPRTAFGAQTQTIGPTRIWVLPSPSPAAHWNWNESVWRALADEVKALRGG
ncbi:MAG TPA: mismatch-specific DNA-glycosylase [Rhizomicrobium sp.]|jgi:TDG/mug DNA glycosylase family protein|nr:mismatch-specific DNA-glycosylase [Rhizomicrobium sp.]